MATSIYCALLLLAVCGALPLQQRSPRGADYSNYEEEVKVIFPDSFNEVLPNIQGLQREMVSLMNKTLISQENVEDKLGNNEIVSLVNKTLSVVDKSKNHLGNIAASQNELIALNNMTLKSQHMIETRLENVEAVLETITGLMGTMVNLLRNQVTPTQPVEEFHSTIPAADETNTELQSARDCQDLAERGIGSSGPYVITPPDGLGSLGVYCDFIDNEGWTVFQRRYDGSVDFYRNWAEYDNGFGDSYGEYWLGLKNIHRLISDGSTWALRIDLESFDEESAYAEYDTFSISDAASNYRLAVGEYSGTAGDSLKNPGHSGAVLNGMQFSTFDRDNDRSSNSGNCAISYQGAFWYNNCHYAHLNGKYLRPGTNDWTGMFWYTWKQSQSLKTSEMKTRRVL